MSKDNDVVMRFFKSHWCEDCGMTLVVEPTDNGPVWRCPACDLHQVTYYGRREG